MGNVTTRQLDAASGVVGELHGQGRVRAGSRDGGCERLPVGTVVARSWWPRRCHPQVVPSLDATGFPVQQAGVVGTSSTALSTGGGSRVAGSPRRRDLDARGSAPSATAGVWASRCPQASSQPRDRCRLWPPVESASALVPATSPSRSSLRLPAACSSGHDVRDGSTSSVSRETLNMRASHPRRRCSGPGSGSLGQPRLVDIVTGRAPPGLRVGPRSDPHASPVEMVWTRSWLMARTCSPLPGRSVAQPVVDRPVGEQIQRSRAGASGIVGGPRRRRSCIGARSSAHRARRRRTRPPRRRRRRDASARSGSRTAPLRRGFPSGRAGCRRRRAAAGSTRRAGRCGTPHGPSPMGRGAGPTGPRPGPCGP